MFKCTYCDRGLKSNAGRVRHENGCKSNPSNAVELTLDEQADPDTCVPSYVDDVPTKEVIEPTDKVVQLEVMGGEETYYDGHPRRLDKLKGLLNRTFNGAERRKISKMIMELSNGFN